MVFVTYFQVNLKRNCCIIFLQMKKKRYFVYKTPLEIVNYNIKAPNIINRYKMHIYFIAFMYFSFQQTLCYN